MEPVTLDELKAWRAPRAVYGVAGFPVRHSLSPPMHTAGFAAAGIDAEYVAFEIPPEQLGEGLDLLEKAGVRGVNLTVPHKERALGLAGTLSRDAELARAVNTMVLGGGRAGHNTDTRGFSRAVREAFSMALRELRVMVVGCGGAGRAVAVQAAREGCERLVLVNRTVAKAEALARDVAALYRTERLEGASARLRARGLDDPELPGEFDQVDLIVNTTPLGLRPGDPPPVRQEWLQPHHLVYDTIYNPARTPLLAAAAEAGARGANGLAMLLHQGALAFEIWFGRPAPLEAMRAGLGKASGGG